MARKHHLGVRLDKAELEALAEVARKADRKLSDMARHIILEYLKNGR